MSKSGSSIDEHVGQIFIDIYIKRRTKVVGTFPDGESALMLVCARLRHITSSVWGAKRYLNMEHLRSMEKEREIEDIG